MTIIIIIKRDRNHSVGKNVDKLEPLVQGNV